MMAQAFARHKRLRKVVTGESVWDGSVVRHLLIWWRSLGTLLCVNTRELRKLLLSFTAGTLALLKIKTYYHRKADAEDWSRRRSRRWDNIAAI
jgi:hypothetical protein